MRNGVALSECPRSYVTGESEAWVQQFFLRQALGGEAGESLPARTAEALFVLEGAFGREQSRRESD